MIINSDLFLGAISSWIFAVFLVVLNANIFHFKISHICKRRSGKSLLLNFWSFICPVHECRNFSTRWDDRVCSRRQDSRKWMTKLSERKTFKVFVHTNNWSKPTEKKSIFAIWIHSVLQSNPRSKLGYNESTII